MAARQSNPGQAMTERDVIIGCGPYDRMASLREGAIATPGYNMVVKTMDVTDIPRAAFEEGRLDVAEISLGELLARVDRGDRSFIGIPAFPSIGFRHDCVYVAASSRFRTPADLANGRIGVTLHLGTTIIWVRQFLEAQFGLDLGAVSWVVGKLDRHVEAAAPAAGPLRSEPASDALTAMLERGEIDAVIAYEKPRGSGPQAIRRLLDDPLESAADYHRRFGAIPLLHVFACRSELLRADGGFAHTLMRALERSKDIAVERLRERACYTSSLPTLAMAVEQAAAIVGNDIWPYGVERNRAALSLFLDAAHRQGLTKHRLSLHDIFPDFA